MSDEFAHLHERQALEIPDDFDRVSFINDFIKSHCGAARNRVEASLEVALAAIPAGSPKGDLVAAVEKLLSLQ